MPTGSGTSASRLIEFDDRESVNGSLMLKLKALRQGRFEMDFLNVTNALKLYLTMDNATYWPHAAEAMWQACRRVDSNTERVLAHLNVNTWGSPRGELEVLFSSPRFRVKCHYGYYSLVGLLPGDSYLDYKGTMIIECARIQNSRGSTAGLRGGTREGKIATRIHAEVIFPRMWQFAGMRHLLIFPPTSFQTVCQSLSQREPLAPRSRPSEGSEHRSRRSRCVGWPGRTWRLGRLGRLRMIGGMLGAVASSGAILPGLAMREPLALRPLDSPCWLCPGPGVWRGALRSPTARWRPVSSGRGSRANGAIAASRGPRWSARWPNASHLASAQALRLQQIRGEGIARFVGRLVAGQRA